MQLTNRPTGPCKTCMSRTSGTGKETNKYRYGIRRTNHEAGRLPGITVPPSDVDTVVSNLSFAREDPREYGGIAVRSLESSSSPTDSTTSDPGQHGRSVRETGIAVSSHSIPKAPTTAMRIGGQPRRPGLAATASHWSGRECPDRPQRERHGADLWPCKQCGESRRLTANAAIWPAGRVKAPSTSTTTRSTAST